MKFKLYLSLILFIQLSFCLCAQPGARDSSFLFSSQNIFSISGDYCCIPFSVQLQKNGRVVICGEMSEIATLNPYLRVIRLHEDGTIKDNFFIDFNERASYSDMVVLPNDKILFTYYSSPSAQDLVRLMPTGRMDTTFGNLGRLIDPEISRPHLINMLPNGNIMLTGFGLNGYTMARYLPDGRIDSLFGEHGYVTTGLRDGTGNGTFKFQPDGKVLVGGYVQDSLGRDLAIERYEVDGGIDSTFGTNGVFLYDMGGIEDSLISIEIKSNHDLLVVASSIGNSDSTYSLLQLNSNGVLDSTFGQAGILQVGFNTPITRAHAAAIQPDDKILVTGTIFDPLSHPTHDFMLVRHNPDGSLDQSFGINGRVTTDFGGGDDHATDLAIQPNGRIIVAGWSEKVEQLRSITDPAVARYLSDLGLGLIDFSISNLPVLIYPNPIQANATLEFSLEKPEVLSIKLLDLNGKWVKTIKEATLTQKGDHKEDFYLDQSIPAGSYLLVIGNSNSSQAIRIVKH